MTLFLFVHYPLRGKKTVTSSSPMSREGKSPDPSSAKHKACKRKVPRDAVQPPSKSSRVVTLKTAQLSGGVLALDDGRRYPQLSPAVPRPCGPLVLLIPPFLDQVPDTPRACGLPLVTRRDHWSNSNCPPPPLQEQELLICFYKMH